MARPTSRPRHPLSDAVIKLREKLGDNQQQFAARLGYAVTTIARYETSRPPDTPSALLMLALTAWKAQCPELEKVFLEAVEKEGQSWGIVQYYRRIEERANSDSILVQALNEVVRNPEYKKEREQIRKILWPIEIKLEARRKEMIAAGTKIHPAAFLLHGGLSPQEVSDRLGLDLTLVLELQNRLGGISTRKDPNKIAEEVASEYMDKLEGITTSKVQQ